MTRSKPLDGVELAPIARDAGRTVSQDATGRDVTLDPSAVTVTMPPLWSCPQGVGMRPILEIAGVAW